MRLKAMVKQSRAWNFLPSYWNTRVRPFPFRDLCRAKPRARAAGSEGIRAFISLSEAEKCNIWSCTQVHKRNIRRRRRLHVRAPSLLFNCLINALQRGCPSKVSGTQDPRITPQKALQGHGTIIHDPTSLILSCVNIIKNSHCRVRRHLSTHCVQCIPHFWTT